MFPVLRLHVLPVRRAKAPWSRNAVEKCRDHPSGFTKSSSMIDTLQLQRLRTLLRVVEEIPEDGRFTMHVFAYYGKLSNRVETVATGRPRLRVHRPSTASFQAYTPGSVETVQRRRL